MSKEKDYDPENTIFCSDLQKVTMLPRAEEFKEVIFMRRLIAFNECFVPVGEKSPATTFAAVWHEGIAGRKKEDLTSTFYQYHTSAEQRHAKTQTLWLDNCGEQNKNYGFYFFYIWLINSDHISADMINLQYVYRGHSLNSADSFHHGCELKFKAMKRLWDFEDYLSCIEKARNKVRIKKMKHNDFYDWADWSLKYKLSNMKDRPYMRNMVHVRFVRGKKISSTLKLLEAK